MFQSFRKQRWLAQSKPTSTKRQNCRRQPKPSVEPKASYQALQAAPFRGRSLSIARSPQPSNPRPMPALCECASRTLDPGTSSLASRQLEAHGTAGDFQSLQSSFRSCWRLSLKVLSRSSTAATARFPPAGLVLFSARTSAAQKEEGFRSYRVVHGSKVSSWGGHPQVVLAMQYLGQVPRMQLGLWHSQECACYILLLWAAGSLEHNLQLTQYIGLVVTPF